MRNDEKMLKSNWRSLISIRSVVNFGTTRSLNLLWAAVRCEEKLTNAMVHNHIVGSPQNGKNLAIGNFIMTEISEVENDH